MEGGGGGTALSQPPFWFYPETEVEKDRGRNAWLKVGIGEGNSHEIKQCTILKALKAFPFKMHFSMGKTLS